ncbi:hypothetical protein BDQ12DRAFT_459921 [Crucibulum laeve]|uniref:Uncharacterized protein n=1 Tax=Crucibulum laeve TaxID=68775 RepID=A0A5C3M5J7_9AGAR|nr:hypothetical protein BDQ12DRAFT_459921 [Crucibulum laeve]
MGYLCSCMHQSQFFLRGRSEFLRWKPMYRRRKWEVKEKQKGQATLLETLEQGVGQGVHGGLLVQMQSEQPLASTSQTSAIVMQGQEEDEDSVSDGEADAYANRTANIPLRGMGIDVDHSDDSDNQHSSENVDKPSFGLAQVSTARNTTPVQSHSTSIASSSPDGKPFTSRPPDTIFYSYQPNATGKMVAINPHLTADELKKLLLPDGTQVDIVLTSLKG